MNNKDSFKTSVQVLLTSEQGDKVTSKPNINFQTGKASGNVIAVKADIIRQTLLGIGSSFTQSSAFVLAHLSPDKRLEVMNQIFSNQGANFSLTRTPIGSCDFCVKGRFSYNDVKDDVNLTNFSITPDKNGFKVSEYPNIKDECFDLLPMIKEAQAIKSQQADNDLKIIASAWTAPAWLKDNNDWYVSGNPANNFSGTGGVLKPECESIFANYLVKYLNAYHKEGVDIWGITPVNEPLGNNGHWESMHFSPQSQNSFIKHHLGPALHKSDYKKTKLFIYDHSRDQLQKWADTIYGDKQTAKYVDGAAVHWYESTFKVFEDVFEAVHKKYPQYAIIHSEGCIDDLGNDAPDGISDPKRFKESGWFDNDSFWWNDNATDWAYSATWAGVDATDHPIYTPVHRYARNIIVSLNHWVAGWIDWNIVLDKNGGPNHVGNYCGAPIMIDTQSNAIYYTPIFYILAQFSQTIRPGDKAVLVNQHLNPDLKTALYSSASINNEQLLSVQILNTQKYDIELSLQIGTQYAIVIAGANSLQTIRIQL